LLILEVSDFRSFTAHHPELAQTIETEAARRKSAEGRPRHGHATAPAIPGKRHR
jgi:hypothetical protein